jgi:hypothetical protein
MADDFESLLEEYGVDFITTGKNTSKDFININCDTSGGDCDYDGNYTLGLHRSGTRSYCWYCSHGFSPFKIAKALGIPWDEWQQTVLEVADTWGTDISTIKEEIDPDDLVDVELPGEEIQQVHRNYLISRGYDPDWLIKHYGIKGTTYYADDYKLKYRIIFPITYEGKVISYIARSYVPDAMNKYICCDPEVETVFHKHLLFNLDKATGDKVIVVEGALDALKLIQASGNFDIVATYGTSYKPEQLRCLRENYEEVIIMYDAEEAAQAKALEIVTYMQSYGKKARSLVLKGFNDPGELDHETAKMVVNHLLKE